MRDAMRIVGTLVAALLLTGCGTSNAPADATDCAGRPTASAWQEAYGQLPYYGDGNFSTPLPDGQSLWVTGDAIPRAGGTWASNTVTVWNECGSWQTPNIVPDTADGQVWWAGPPIAVAGKVLSFGSLIRRTPGVWPGFTSLGARIAVMNLPAGGFIPTLDRIIVPPQGPVRWAAGVWSNGTTVYVWGTADPIPGHWGHPVYLAKVSAVDLLAGRTSAWRYWTKAGWTASQTNATMILEGTDSAFSVRHEPSGIWRLYTRRGGHNGADHGEYVGMPGCAWTWQTRGTEPGYLPAAHPEAQLASGLMLVTVNVDGYGPHFLEVSR